MDVTIVRMKCTSKRDEVVCVCKPTKSSQNNKAEKVEELKSLQQNLIKGIMICQHQSL
jgi:hypothetical protein